jgi:hypothetical protein
LPGSSPVRQALLDATLFGIVGYPQTPDLAPRAVVIAPLIFAAGYDRVMRGTVGIAAM